MSWIKKIIGKKEAADSPDAPSNDETVLFGDDSAPSTPPMPSRSSMISELAGLDPESSADLSSELESTPAELLDQHSEESISLDFDDPSDQQEAAMFGSNEELPQELSSGQQQTANTPEDIVANNPVTDNQGRDLDSDQQQTAVFDQPFGEGQPTTPAIAQAPASGTPDSSIPELEFDSDPRLDTDFDKPLASQLPSAEPASGYENSAAAADSIPESGEDHGLAGGSETLPPSQPPSMIDQMAGEFDLDLGEADEPTAEAFPAILKGSDTDAMIDQPTNERSVSEQPPTESAPEKNLEATADGEDYFDQLATANLNQPLTAAIATPEAEPQNSDDFNATVITTAANEPNQAAGADFVTGWLVVVDGPGKGQSRPIRAGINAVGRAPDQAIPLYFGAKSDGEISRRDHARIVYDARGNHFKLVHGASRNLTYLNDEAVLEITDLKAYDRIVIGKTTLLFLPLCGNIFRW